MFLEGGFGETFSFAASIVYAKKMGHIHLNSIEFKHF